MGLKLNDLLNAGAVLLDSKKGEFKGYYFLDVADGRRITRTIYEPVTRWVSGEKVIEYFPRREFVVAER